jgi:hypothetical protein
MFLAVLLLSIVLLIENKLAYYYGGKWPPRGLRTFRLRFFHGTYPVDGTARCAKHPRCRPGLLDD